MAETRRLESSRWERDVRQNLNDLILQYGIESEHYDPSCPPYAVFDWDNTTTIFDCEEQVITWQMDHLAFAFQQENVEEILRSGLQKEDLDRAFGAMAGHGRAVRIGDVIYDIGRDFRQLAGEGKISRCGREQTEETKQSGVFRDFTSKMRWLYLALEQTLGSEIAYSWLTYWFTGMTGHELYQMSMASYQYYSDEATPERFTVQICTGLEDYRSRAGTVLTYYKAGIAMSPEMRELYQTLGDNGIHIYVNSASAPDVVRAAADYFQMPGITGILGMESRKDARGCFKNEYDTSHHDITQGEGKCRIIDRVIAPRYRGRGPILCGMDSQGDFNFATEYRDTKAVLIMNKNATDDAAICAAVARFQKQHHIDLDRANSRGNARFLLQGRNEREGRLWSKTSTVSLAVTEDLQSFDNSESIVQALKLSEKKRQDLEVRVIKELKEGASLKKIFSKYTVFTGYPGYKHK